MTGLWAGVAHRLRPELMWTTSGGWEADRLPDGLRMTSQGYVLVHRVVGVPLGALIDPELPKDQGGAGILPDTDLNSSDAKINTGSAPASEGAEAEGGPEAHTGPPSADPHTGSEDDDGPDQMNGTVGEPSRGRTRVLYPYDPRERGWEPARLPRGGWQ